MKILVADDEPTVLRIMRAFLEKHRFEVETVDCGRKAIAALTAEGGPSIAIIDWMMPDLTGPEVCTQLRQTRFRIRPYLLILTSKNSEADLAAGLDAGADDFVTKPFKSAEMLARLRAAERIIAYEHEVQQRIEELEQLVERHELLGEMIARSGQSAEPAPAFPPVGAPTLAPSPLPPQEIENLARRALQDLGLRSDSVVRESPPSARGTVTYAAWTALLRTQGQRWTDLVLEAEADAVTTIFTRALDRAPGPSQCQSLVVEALTVIASALRSALQAHGVELLAPFLARGQQVDRRVVAPPIPGESIGYTFNLAGSAITLLVVDRPCPVVRKPSHDLGPGEILAQPYPPAVPLLGRGTVLNDRFVAKLQIYGDTTAGYQPVPVFEPTALAQFFQSGASR
ncbi:MAG TPA: response regulator [Opitutaceae bacterium]|nr:response regulator [Opitutaceae bacterium]